MFRRDAFSMASRLVHIGGARGRSDMRTEQRNTLRAAIAAIEAGDPIAGRRMLSDVLRKDPACAEAWLWMSRIAKSDHQRHEYLRRALSPRDGTEAGPASITDVAQVPGEQTLSTYVTPGELPTSAASVTDLRCPWSAQTTRIDVRDPPATLTEDQRQAGQRKVMLAGAMAFSLFCGVALLVYLVLTIVPAANERMRQRYMTTPYQAVMSCPSCDESGRSVTLRDRPSHLFSRTAGTVAPGTVVTVVGEEWAQLEGCVYVHVQTATQRGWVRAIYVRR